MRIITYTCLLILLAALAACKPTIDGSSEEAMKASINAMKESFPSERQAEPEEGERLDALLEDYPEFKR
jgi:hypothetical protein